MHYFRCWLDNWEDGKASIFRKVKFIVLGPHKDLSSNPERYPSPPYFPKRFGKLDFESFSLSPKDIQKFEG
jgi:hypothetical protein